MAYRGGFGSKNITGLYSQRTRVLAVSVLMCLVTLAVGMPLFGRVKAPTPPAAPAIGPTPVPKVTVYFALRTTPPGTRLQPAMFRSDQLNAVAVSTLGREVVKSEADFIGKIANTVITPGSPVFLDQLGENIPNTIVRKIKPGYRAVTIKVDDVTGIEGWGAPGAKVDVLWITQSKNEAIVSVIVKNAPVLSVMGRIDTPQEIQGPAQSSAPPQALRAVGTTTLPPQFTVSLLVSPEEGQRIMLASSSGRLSLMLRGEFDLGQDTTASASMSVSELLNRDKPQSPLSQAEQTEGSVRVKRDDGTYDEWSVIEGRVWKWDQGKSG